MTDHKKRIPAGELTAYERWELPSLGESAKPRTPARRREEVKPLTAADLERIRQEAYQEGFEQGKQDGFKAGQASGHEEGLKQGREEGKAQGLQEGQAHIKHTQQQLTRLMQCLSEPLSEEQGKAAESMLNVSLAIARSVIRRELLTDSKVIQEVILEALSLLPRHSKNVVFRVNQMDAEYVRESLDAADSLAEVKVDPEVQAGGCLVDSTTQQYDFTIEKRFQKLVHQMLMRASNEQPQQKAGGQVSATMEERADFHGTVLAEAESEQPDTPVSAALPGTDLDDASSESEQGGEAPEGSEQACSPESDHHPEPKPAPSEERNAKPEADADDAGDADV